MNIVKLVINVKKYVTYWPKIWPNWLLHYLKNDFKSGDWILLDLLNLQVNCQAIGTSW
jgi:hypothetical protein